MSRFLALMLFDLQELFMWPGDQVCELVARHALETDDWSLFALGLALCKPAKVFGWLAWRLFPRACASL